MRQTPASGTPAAACGLSAAVLLAVLAVLHAACIFGPAHASQPGADDCRQRTTATQERTCAPAPLTLAAREKESHHQDGEGSQSCDAPGYATPQSVRDGVAPATACTAADHGMPECAHPAVGRGTPPHNGAAAARSTVLRC
ncbi:hypothetical protein ACFWRZ_05065 [Streptomyces rubiginosohelvolus]|uniref:hypothetical protein n=1 Tax=Streptomyces TaxID=1883 RepID=UPI0030D512B8